jgi:hypothetical protein
MRQVTALHDNLPPVRAKSMRGGTFGFIALVLGGCTSPASLDSARQQLLEARSDYQECVNRSSADVANNCEAKRVTVEGAERAYKDAMSSGLH